MNATSTPAAPLVRLFDLPLGSRFRYAGKPDVFVFLGHEDCGLVGDGPVGTVASQGTHRFQGLYSACESRREFEELMVEFVNVQEVKS